MAVATDAEVGLARWLTSFALGSDDEVALFGGFCDRLTEAGVPVEGATAGSFVVHPLLDARSYRWRRGQPAVEREDFQRGHKEREAWRVSPFRHMLDIGADELRRTLGRSYRQGEFPAIDDLVRAGCTDYLALAVSFGDGTALGPLPGVIVAFWTTQVGGYREAETALLRQAARHFGLAYKTLASVHTGRVLMTTYLGADPGRRVLEGAVARGRPEMVRAVLWYSDLKGFTRIADTAGSCEVMGLLNEYADGLVSTIAAHGGEVLKFIGDGILAMFPLGPDGPCTRALDAVREALDVVDAMARRREGAGLPHTDIHLALHVGEVLYGNIGSRDRLDFTVVGPAVNEVARIEAMCRQLDQRVVVSSAFAASASAEAKDRLVSLGRYALRGVRRPEELFTIDPDAQEEGCAAATARAAQ